MAKMRPACGARADRRLRASRADAQQGSKPDHAEDTQETGVRTAGPTRGVQEVAISSKIQQSMQPTHTHVTHVTRVTLATSKMPMGHAIARSACLQLHGGRSPTAHTPSPHAVLNFRSTSSIPVAGGGGAGTTAAALAMSLGSNLEQMREHRAEASEPHATHPVSRARAPSQLQLLQLLHRASESNRIQLQLNIRPARACCNPPSIQLQPAPEQESPPGDTQECWWEKSTLSKARTYIHAYMYAYILYVCMHALTGRHRPLPARRPEASRTCTCPFEPSARGTSIRRPER